MFGLGFPQSASIVISITYTEIGINIRCQLARVSARDCAQDNHIGNSFSVSWVLLKCLLEGGLCLLDAAEV